METINLYTYAVLNANDNLLGLSHHCQLIGTTKKVGDSFTKQVLRKPRRYVLVAVNNKTLANSLEMPKQAAIYWIRGKQELKLLLDGKKYKLGDIVDGVGASLCAINAEARSYILRSLANPEVECQFSCEVVDHD